MKKNSFGQGTIEYLVIIGVVIVIALIVVGLLTSFLDHGSNINTNSQSISQKTQQISLGTTIASPTGNYTLEIQSNEAQTINITKITTDDDYELFSNETMPLGTKKIFPIYTNQTCTEGTTITKNITIEYTTRQGLEKIQRFENVVIPCQSVNVDTEKLINPLLNISFIDPTPQNNFISDQNTFDINVFSQGSKNISTFIDFNNSLIGWWRMDDYNSTHVLDYMENNPGSFQGGLSSEDIVDGKMGKALEFDGISSAVVVSHNDNQLLTTGGSISAWINPVSGGGGGFGRIVDKTPNGWYWYILDSNRVGFVIDSVGRFSAADSVPFNQWSHVVVTFDATGLVTFYVNGVQSGTPGTTGLPSGITATNPLTIGNISTATIRAFDGLIDEVMVYNRVLTAEEVGALYAGSSEKYLDTNFSDLNNGDYVYTAYSQDTIGNVVQTEERKITIQN